MIEVLAKVLIVCTVHREKSDAQCQFCAAVRKHNDEWNALRARRSELLLRLEKLLGDKIFTIVGVK